MVGVNISIFLLILVTKCSASSLDVINLKVSNYSGWPTDDPIWLTESHPFYFQIESDVKVENFECESPIGYLKGKLERSSTKTMYDMQITASKDMDGKWICYNFYINRIKFLSWITIYMYIHVDVDECIAIPSPCSTNANCTNTLGSYECTCLSGYAGNGTYCEDKPTKVSVTNDPNESVTVPQKELEDKPTKVSATNDPNESVTVPQKEVEGRSGTTTILIVAFSTMVLTSILAFIIFKVVLQRRLNKAQVVDQGLQSPSVDEPQYETVDSCIDISKRAPYPLPAEALNENNKYVHYDTPYEWRIWRFGVIPKRREQPPRRRGSQDIQ